MTRAKKRRATRRNAAAPATFRRQPVRSIYYLPLVALTLASLLLTGVLLAPTTAPYSAPAAKAQTTPYTVSGRVYDDSNSNGLAEGLPARLELGVAGVTVQAYDGAGAVIGTATTDATGNYSLNIASGVPVRVEFDETTFPTGYRSSWFNTGGNSTTSVTFVSGQSNVSLGIIKPVNYCQDNPLLVTNCYFLGYQNSPADTTPVLVSYPYNAGAGDFTNGIGATPPTRFDNPTTHQISIPANQIGTTWGMAYERSGKFLYAAAYMKRHAGFGPGGPGAIYKIDTATNTVVGGTPYFDLNSISSAGPDLHVTSTVDNPPWFFDYVTTTAAVSPTNPFTNTFDAVGKMALGDLDISEDGTQLYVVNLFDRTLYRMPAQAGSPTPAQVASFPIPQTAPGCALGGGLSEIRPFGLGIYNGRVYVGAVCSAQASQSTAGLRAYVFEFNPLTGSFNPTPVLNFPLNFARGCADTFGCTAPSNMTANWNSWTPTFKANDRASSAPALQPGGRVASYPQPMITNVAFENGNMILAFRDRFGDQVGFASYSNPVSPTTLYGGIGAGDILRACATGPGTWQIENAGNCNGKPSNITSPQGPGGGEYYPFEGFPYYDLAGTEFTGTRNHDEISLGGVTYVPGQPDIVATAFDPLPFNGQILEGGMRWYSTQNVTVTRAYRLYNSDDNIVPPSFGKASGLGDIEAICNEAPLEIGNRVWFDLNRNGIQDAEDGVLEKPVVGATVRLYDGATLIASTTTNARGEYIFNDNTPGVPGAKLKRNYNGYIIRLDNPADYATGPLTGFTSTILTVPGDNGTAVGQPRPRFINSNGITTTNALFGNGYPESAVLTGASGQNDHTYDFGFVQAPPPPTPTPTPTPTFTPQPTSTPPPTSTPVPTATPAPTTPVVTIPPTTTEVPTVTPPPPTPLVTTPLPPTPVPPTVPVENPESPSPFIRKVADKQVASPGDKVRFTIQVSNPNNSPITNLIVTDDVPNAFLIQNASVAQGTVSVNGQRVTANLGTLAPGESTNIIVDVVIRPGVTGAQRNVAILEGDLTPLPSPTPTVVPTTPGEGTPVSTPTPLPNTPSGTPPPPPRAGATLIITPGLPNTGAAPVNEFPAGLLVGLVLILAGGFITWRGWRRTRA